MAHTLTMVRKRSFAEAESAARSTDAVLGVVDGVYKNPSEASTATGTLKTTVYRRAKGGNTRQEAHAYRQALSPDEENVLVSWIERLAVTGHPVKHSFVRELAEEIRKPRVELEDKMPPPLSKDWPKRFLKRHPTLKTMLAQNIESKRKQVTREEVENYFAEFKRIVEQHNIQTEDIYNYDETGSY